MLAQTKQLFSIYSFPSKVKLDYKTRIVIKVQTNYIPVKQGTKVKIILPGVKSYSQLVVIFVSKVISMERLCVSVYKRQYISRKI